MKALRHNPTDSYFFPPDVKKLPDAGAKLTPEEAASHLGASPAEVSLLVDEGHIRTNRDGLITGRSIKEFCDGLTPVNLVEVKDSPVAKVGPKTNPRRGNPAMATTAPAARTSTKAKAKAELEAYEPETFSATCPNCDQDLVIAGDVLAFKCPNCGRKLTISRPIDAEADVETGDQGDDEPRTNPGFLGIFGGRKGG